MELTIASDADKEQWDTLVNRSQNGSIFYTWKWLKLVEKHSHLKFSGLQAYGKFFPLFIIDKEKPNGIYPLFLFKTPLYTLCYSPPSNVDLLCLGPLFPDIHTMRQEKKQIFLHDMQILVDRFIRKDLKASYIQINTPPGFEDCRFFKWGGYEAEPRYTYYIDLNPGLDQIWKNFNKSLRYYIDKAKKEGITVTEGTKEDALFIYDMLKERGRIKSSKEFIGDIFDDFFPDHIKVFVAQTGTEHLSGIITIIDRNKVKFWIGSPKCSYKGLSPNELVLWESIRWAKERGYSTFEIEGADDYSLFPFKRKFNGKIIPYYQMKWRSPLLAIFSSLYHSFKRGNNYLEER